MNAHMEHFNITKDIVAEKTHGDGYDPENRLLASPVNNSQDLHEASARSSKEGQWTAAKYIIGNEALNSLGFYGATVNLVVYFTNVLHQGNATAANNVSTWTGTASLFPIFGAFLGDAYLGRYWTSIMFSIVYLLGMGLLIVSASLPALRPPPCSQTSKTKGQCKKASPLQTSIFNLALYVMSLGSTGYVPCLTALGADQFDEENEEEKQQQSSFFNWFYLSVNVGALFASTLVIYVEQSVSWGLGFGICLGAALSGTLLLFWGSPTYRLKKSGGNPMQRVLQVLVASIRKWRVHVPNECTANGHIVDDSKQFLSQNRLHEVSDKHSAIKGSRKIAHTNAFRILDKAATETLSDRELVNRGQVISPWRLCTVTQVEEVKFVLRLFPVWLTTILFSTVYVQMSTLFVEQGTLMNTHIMGGLNLPAAAISSFDTIGVILWVPIYDRLIVRVARMWTGNPRGLTSLQRIGTGLAISILSMVAAAIIEAKRLRLAEEEGVAEFGGAVTGLSVFWQVPQYAIIGAAEVFTYIGQMELFYNESPDALRSLSSALMGLGSAIGNYLSALLVTLVNRFTSSHGDHRPWIPEDNLNVGHINNFFWLLAIVSAINLLLFLWFARRYQYTVHVA